MSGNIQNENVTISSDDNLKVLVEQYCSEEIAADLDVEPEDVGIEEITIEPFKGWDVVFYIDNTSNNEGVDCGCSNESSCSVDGCCCSRAHPTGQKDRIKKNKYCGKWECQKNYQHNHFLTGWL